jgi:hypothetical protein
MESLLEPEHVHEEQSNATSSLGFNVVSDDGEYRIFFGGY